MNMMIRTKYSLILLISRRKIIFLDVLVKNMTIIRQNYQEQLDELLKDIRRMGLYTYFNINNAIVSLSEKTKILRVKSLIKIKILIN